MFVSAWDDVINATYSVSTIVTNTVSINSDDKKMTYKMHYILDTVLLVIILLFIIPIVCYHYTQNISQNKNVLPH